MDNIQNLFAASRIFFKWCKAQPVEPGGRKPRTLDECRKFTSAWIQSNVENPEISAYTVRLQAAALAKLYNCKTTDFDVKYKKRERKNITRSRLFVEDDRHFSEKNNAESVTFCKCTGIRRAELKQIRGSDLVYKNGQPYLHITRGTKGGKPRFSEIVGTTDEVDFIVRLCKKAGDKKLFDKVSKHLDVHHLRAVYAKRIYQKYARESTEFYNERMIIYNNKIIEIYRSNDGFADEKRLAKYCDKNGILKKGYRDVPTKYVCRKDLKEVIYDRQALFKVSKNLGHNRENVVVGHYLYH